MNSWRMEWKPEDYEENARFVSDLGANVVQLLAPQPNERVLDLGCGDGVLTKEISCHGCSVFGVDSSPEMVEAAKSRGVDAEIADGANLDFEEEFDAVFSNAAIHWMDDLDAVVAGVQRALKLGGRFVGEFGGHGNVSKILGAVEHALVSRGHDYCNPWNFPTESDFRDVLERHGFKVALIDTFSRPTSLPGDVRGWLRTFGAPILSGLSDSDQSSIVKGVFNQLSKSIVNKEGIWVADYVRLRFRATKSWPRDPAGRST